MNTLPGTLPNRRCMGAKIDSTHSHIDCNIKSYMRYCAWYLFAPRVAPRCLFNCFQLSPVGEHVSDVSDVLSVGQVVDVRIREVRSTMFLVFCVSCGGDTTKMKPVCSCC